MARDGDCGVLCRYFFPALKGEDDVTGVEAQESSLMLSVHPTLAELRRKFPFEGQYHFRLQHMLGNGSYCWMDLVDKQRVLPVSDQREIRVKVLQLFCESQESETDDESFDEDHAEGSMYEKVDVAEDQQFQNYFRWQHAKNRGNDAYDPSGVNHQPQDVAGVLFGVKKALTSKMMQSSMAQTLQKRSAKMWEKVMSVSSSGSGAMNAPPTASTLAQLAKLMGSMKTLLHESNREHVDFLSRLWVACFDTQPFVLHGPAWERLGFRYGDPLREIQFLLPLQCLVFFHEVHRTVALPILNDQAMHNPETYAYALVGSKIAFVVADILQLKDGSCLGLERPFWRLFEDPIAFFELYCIVFRAFNQSWKMNANKSIEIGFHLDYAADFAQELLRRGPETVPMLVEYAYQMQNW